MCWVMLLAYISIFPGLFTGRYFYCSTGLSTVLLSVSCLLAQVLSLFFLVLLRITVRAKNKHR